MSQAGYTPIQLYYSTTASAAPSAANLVNGELAINITDGKLYYKDNTGVVRIMATAGTGTGTVTSVAQSFTGGLISVSGSPVTTSGTLALTVAGTSGGIPYFSSASTWASSSALTANAIMVGGGAGAAPSTITTGTGVVTALGVNTGSAGAFVVNGGALGTPSSGTVTNLTGTASININGTVGATTANTGAFTTLSASGVTSLAAGSVSAPGLYLSTDSTTGFYRIGANNYGFAVSGTKLLDIASGKQAIVGTGYSPNIALSDAATVAWDTNTGQVATFTFVSSNRTMGAPTNLVSGAFYALAVIQNAGSNTLTWNSVFKWAAGSAPTLSTAAGAKDYFTFRSDGTNLYEQGRSLGVA